MLVYFNFRILFNLEFFVALLVSIFNDSLRIFPIIFPLNYKFFCFLLLYRKRNNVFLTYLNLESIFHDRDSPRDHGWMSRLLILEEYRMGKSSSVSLVETDVSCGFGRVCSIKTSRFFQA